jgi:thiosulfate/3-mercaptopyruvate sulfurtransferase
LLKIILDIRKITVLNLVISTNKLFNLIKQKQNNLRIVDTRSFDEYSKGHIPSAVNIDLMQYHWNDTSKSGIKNFNVQMQKLLSTLGLNPKTLLVFYDNISGPSASRGVWLSLYFSHNKVVILNGGLNAWIKENKPIETQPERLKYNRIENKINQEILADVKTISKILKNKMEIQIIDSRSPKEYSGEYIRAVRGGHIPSAINIDWNENITNDKFKTEDTLRKIYSEFSKNKEIITYCQGGYRAANTFIILRQLGFKKVKMYLGSWNEWGNDERLPIEKEH